MQAVYCPNPGGIIHIDNNAHGSPSSCTALWLIYRGPKEGETEFSLAGAGSVTPNVDDSRKKARQLGKQKAMK